MERIYTVVQCRADGTFYFNGYAWPGGYPIVYLDNTCADLCSTCATDIFNKQIYGDTETAYRVEDFYVHYEGESVICELCDTEIESAYGVPEDTTEEPTEKEKA